MELNIGDIIFQFINLLLPIIFIIFIVLFFRSTKTRNNHLKQLEDKLDRISKQIEK